MSLNKKLILGCAQSDDNYGLSRNKKFEEVLQNAIKSGLNFLDTSPYYRNSSSIIKKFNSKKNINIISKLKFDYDLKSNFEKRIRNDIDNILRANNTKVLYGLLIHDSLLPLNSKKWKIVFKVLNEYKEKKIIKKIGISVYNTFELDNILKIFTPEIIQFPLNVFYQSFANKELLKKLKRQKIELHARSIFLQGSLLKNFKSLSPQLKIWRSEFLKWSEFLSDNKINALKASLVFALNNELIDKFVIGLDNKKQFEAVKNEFIKIQKNKKLLNNLNFNKLNSDNIILTDPRYWYSINNKEKLNYKKWIDLREKVLNGGMLLSKRPDQFLPAGWPTFYRKASGCHIWDINNKKYLDFSLMGVGTNILGYSNKSINNHVIKNINNGSISTLNSGLDKLLAEKLIKIHPWSKMATFSRTGAEANAIAIRIARIFSQKDEIAICGYHGWHDWYLSSNLSNKKNLDEIHLSGLSTIGIPKKLKGLTHPFRYNDIKGFKKLLRKNPNIGTVFMEVERNEKPKNNFLKQIRNITKRKKIVLIFDECTSGFRETNGGLHKKYKIYPDIAVFGKSIGNGIPITAVIGKKEIMIKARKSFISSTFWTDATGPAAALSTLKEMERIKSWKKITKIGRRIKMKWLKLSKKYKIKIKIQGIDALPSFSFDSNLNLYFKTFITQEMLKKKILATNSVYCCIQHEKYLNIYFKELEKIFSQIKKISDGKSIAYYLRFPVSQPGFSRLN